MGGISSMHRRYKYHIHNRSQNKINIRALWRNRRKWEDNIKIGLKYGARLWPQLFWLTLESSYQHDKYKAYLCFPSLACLFVSLYDWQKDQSNTYVCCRSQRPRGLRRRSTALRLLGAWVRIPLGAWTFVCYEWCVCCQVEVSVTSWPLVQGSPTDCGASLCVTSKPHEWGVRIKQPEPLGGACSK